MSSLSRLGQSGGSGAAALLFHPGALAHSFAESIFLTRGYNLMECTRQCATTRSRQKRWVIYSGRTRESTADNRLR